MTGKEKTGSDFVGNVISNTTQTQCRTCVLDTSAKEIVFTETGCNFCDAARVTLKEINYGKNIFHYSNHFKALKTNGEYDVLIGLSGGVDSSITLHQAVKYGLRPLCFSIDTGYNKPEADENIMRLVESLKVPFYRYTIDLVKFKELQGAFMRAGVKNIEIPTDHVLMAASYEMAVKYGIRTILSGGNVATESIMPASWGHNARDLTHIKDIYRRFTGKKLTQYGKPFFNLYAAHFPNEGKAISYGDPLPLCSIWKWNWYRWGRKIKVFYLLDYFDYNRAAAERLLIKTYGFKSTGEKHEENYFTWWFQNFYLFEKFGIDKRKAHLSSLIVSGQMSRKEALEVLQGSPVYPELGIEQRVLKYPRHDHEDYKMDQWYERIAKVVKLFV